MLEYKSYMGKIEFDDEANLFHGEVVGIRDVVTFQGTSVEEIRTAFRESIDDYLDYCESRGEEPDRPCSGKFVLRIGPELHRKISMMASVSGRTLNSFVTECLKEQVERELQNR